jgi:hypothetical protein
MNNSLAITSPDDFAVFATLPEVVRMEVDAWRAALDPVFAADTLSPVVTQVATRMQVSVQTVWRKYYAAKADGWRGLINGRHVPQAREEVPDVFCEFWKTLCQENARKCRPAYRKLVGMWRSGAEIPGYEGWNGSRADLPKGWTYRNLMRYQPTKFELTAARVGRSAAASYRPTVRLTRVGLSVGEYYLFDDLWHDFMVAVPGQTQARRLLQFHALDLYSAMNVARGLKPITKDLVTGAEERLNEAEMRFLVAHILAVHGFRPEGTTLVVEHGTAAIREDLERRILDVTGGVVTVARSGIEGGRVLAFEGRGHGNFRFKAALESSGNLIHNETADMRLLPGQTGSNSRLNEPEELHGRQRLYGALVKAAATLSPERAARLRLPFVELHQAISIVTEIHDRINERTEHELEGWVEAGLTSEEFRFGGEMPWQPMGRCTESQRQIIASFLQDRVSDIQVRTRRLSPREVWDAGRPQLTRLNAAQAAILLGPDLGREATAKAGRIEFEDQDLAPGPLCYDVMPLLPDGQKACVVVNPMDLGQLFAFDAKGRFLGIARRVQAVCRNDAEGLKHAMGRAAKAEKELLAPVVRRGAAVIRQRIEDARVNAEILAGPREARAPALARGGDAREFEELAGDCGVRNADCGLGTGAEEQMRALEEL